ncbi:MAG: hypothetical protein JWO42_3544 [Chloroflexi bacterium]|nr:hypothetical protein [Chloroflexota bacterium]
MSLASLDPADREAISQLRALLRGDHQLTVEQEDELIAAFLAGRSTVVAVASPRGRNLPTHPSQWHDAVLRPLVIQAGAVSITALISLQHAAFSGVSLYYDAYGADMSVAFVAALAGLFLLALFPVRAWLGHQMGRASELTCIAISSIVGAELLEYAALHWPTNSSPSALHIFFLINLLALFVAAMVAVATIAYGLARQRGGPAPANRRLAAEQQPRLSGHFHS